MICKDEFIVVPAYNEEKSISVVLERLINLTSNIIVVDDCSSDRTWEIICKYNVYCIRHCINLGQGGALQTGIEYALKVGAKAIVTFDADGQHDEDEISGMLDLLRNSDNEIILGSRFLGNTTGIPSSRAILLKMAILFTRISTGIAFTDAHNGFRAMKRSFAEKFQFKQNRMAHASELLNFIGKNKIVYAEYPVTIRYTTYSLGKGQKTKNALHILLELAEGEIFK